VKGRPAPQGSKIRNRYGAIYEASRHLKPWRDAITAEVLQSSVRTVTDPVRLSVTFRISRPQRLPKGRFLPSVPPDADKLLRSVLDALTHAKAISDDSLVTDFDVQERYTDDSHPDPGADIKLYRMFLIDPHTGREI
jgi:Holliday junction resolvase RusA-like endonuclease